MTCRLKIAAKLTHPFLNAAPLWPDNHPPDHKSLHPVMKYKLLPLYIPLRGMSQHPCKLESGGLVIVFCQTKAVSKQEWSGFQPVVLWAYWPGTQRKAAAVVSPGWSASRLRPGAPLWSFFSPSALWLCVSVPKCGPSGCCQADHGNCCELPRLSVSTYILFPEEGEGKELKEKRKTMNERWEEGGGGYNRGMEQVHSSTFTKHVRRGNCKPSKIQTSNFLKQGFPSPSSSYTTTTSSFNSSPSPWPCSGLSEGIICGGILKGRNPGIIQRGKCRWWNI